MQESGAQSPANGSLRRSLTTRHITFMALGSAIGTGLFMGSAGAIQTAGPAVLFAYVIGGAVVFMVMRALGELAVREPVAGSFASYATRYVGPLAGFLAGWTYVFEMLVVALADVTAFGIYMGFWFPNVERWIWVLAAVLFIATLNMFSVRAFGELEFSFTIIKVSAIVLMIVGGIAVIVFGLGNQSEGAAGIANLVNHGGMLPNGWWGFIACFTIVMFAFGGIEVIGLTAGEAKNPGKVLPRAINSVPLRILVFYVLTLGVIMCLQPWNEIDGSQSPFVGVFDSLGIPAAAHIMNFVIIVAALSAINADVFGAGRMMHGLATQRQAPASFARTNKGGVPAIPVIVMVVALLAGVVINAVFPDQVFFLIAALATFATVFVWLVILIAHVRMKREVAKQGLAPSAFPVPLWPAASYAAIVFVVLVIVLIAIVPDTRPAVYVGAGWLAVLAIVYAIMKSRRGPQPVATAGPKAEQAAVPADQ